MTPEQRGERARTLLNNDVLKEAFETAEADCIAQWKATKAHDTDLREKLWTQVRAFDVIRSKLHQAIADGEIAKRSM